MAATTLTTDATAAPAADALSDYSRAIFVGHYARTLDSGVRETYEQTTDRFVEFLFTGNEHVRRIDTPETRRRVRDAVLRTEVMPSMRAFQTAGPAATRDNTTMYNCAYVAMDRVCRFGEIMYVSMCGTGVGFSCERHVVARLPLVAVARSMSTPPLRIEVDDSKEGWKAACDTFIEYVWVRGHSVVIDYSHVRPAGAPLRTMGGVASGPEPLRSFFERFQATLDAARGRHLRPAEVHHLVCQIAEIVQMGGVRRSALISLFSVDDDEMLTLKSGTEWQRTAPWLANANNSAVFDYSTDATARRSTKFVRLWAELQAGHSGEPGIFNRAAARAAADKVRRLTRCRGEAIDFGINPCGEIVLRPAQFCNLTEVVVRHDDTADTLWRKVETAVLIGAMQSTFTHFPWLSPEWGQNCREERLLGVSLTGIYDNAQLSTPSAPLKAMLHSLRGWARTAAAYWATKMGVGISAAVTCIKPSGTVSQLVDAASGIHPRWSDYYVRSLRCTKIDPMYAFLRDAGVPCEDDAMKPVSGAVFFWPIKAPAHGRTRNLLTAIEQLELWHTYVTHWCEHNASCTVNIRDNEWGRVGAWVHEHLSDVIGLALLPFDGGTYQQPVFRACTEAEYTAMAARMPRIDWAALASYEAGTTYRAAVREPACSAGGCEIGAGAQSPLLGDAAAAARTLAP